MGQESLDTSRRRVLALSAAAAATQGLTPAAGLASPLHLVTGLDPAVALFVGRAASGPVGQVTPCLGRSAFAQLFGTDGLGAELWAAVDLYFRNGGGAALVYALPEATPAAYDAAWTALAAAPERFDLVVLPAPPDPAPWAAASQLCRTRRALLLIDPPTSWMSAATAQAGVAALRNGLAAENAALYFPRLRVADPGGGERIVAPAGAVAGVISRTDRERGIWKTPAGTDAGLRDVIGPTLNLTQAEGEALNRLGVDALQTFTGRPLVWGGRTLIGYDGSGSDWKYIPVRRLALGLEEALTRGLAWAAAEPNAEPLWAQVRLMAGAFLQDLFRRGAFQGATASQAYLVKCDGETMTPDDIANGRLNLLVGFAPLKPAEFVILHIQGRAASIA